MTHNSTKAFTYVELLVALSISIIVFGSIFGLFITTKQFYAKNIAGQALQRDANKVIAKVLKGTSEPGGIFRLSEAVTRTRPFISEVHFWGTDNNERWYRVSADGKSIIYHHPTNMGVQDEIIYTTPADTALTLRFWLPAGALYQNVGVGIDVGLTRTVSGKNFSGSASSMIIIRNHN